MSQAIEQARRVGGMYAVRGFALSKGTDRRYTLGSWFTWSNSPQGYNYWRDKGGELIAHLIRGD